MCYCFWRSGSLVSPSVSLRSIHNFPMLYTVCLGRIFSDDITHVTKQHDQSLNGGGTKKRGESCRISYEHIAFLRPNVCNCLNSDANFNRVQPSHLYSILNRADTYPLYKRSSLLWYGKTRGSPTSQLLGAAILRNSTPNDIAKTTNDHY